ncbi:type ISP restriction/modification enzyme [Tautonia plasticadhaerens]|uniref:site-specific DNA-methyltransferase (adenine-specific) n=1 Tax=Tautonia plasticadhaerens TaxID=2527974 RepID=A0A518H219_9BACT|nr:type ISP restriction/modification enzyme [Tautonia plasticadhaerens]QDV34875.1 N-6 DNA Methylase [Tautonia plasticadhaerens]
MPAVPVIKATHKAVPAYYEALQAYAGQSVSHETALRSAFQNLLAETGKLHKWTLIPELTMKVKGRSIRPDGTLRDGAWLFPRGYWEAKDTDDKLEDEIRKKIAQGYPTINTIFEDTREGILYQNGKRVMRAKLQDPEELVGLLNQFYAHTERDFEGFEQAVIDFRDRIPSLAKALLEKIEDAHKNTPKFAAAFQSLLELCRTSLNPNISDAAVDEMLVQHLLTERLFERVFQNQEFVRRNVIAAEVEKVIEALVSKSFNRQEFLKSLNPFYTAIEKAARTIEDFGEKQYFLNSVYERFFQGYSVKLADTHGIVYTPQAIVDFMCASVDGVLKSEFKKKLTGEGVNILDPCTGTGNFLVNLLRRFDRRELPRAYENQLFANEVMLLPYYIASQNIEHEYFELTGEYVPFDGLCFVDTLELADESGKLSFVTEENTDRVNRQQQAQITVIIGNPPYNIGQVNENDRNKNRKYKVVDNQIKHTYARDSRATLSTKLYDPYVKFFRWATDRLGGRDGIVCFVTNNSFVHKFAFDGMRKHLLDDFTRVYHLDLMGDVKSDPKLSGTAYNVFGIQVGVGITVAIRSAKHKRRQLFYAKVDKQWRREEKLTWLARVKSISGVEWEERQPDSRYDWLGSGDNDEFDSFLPLGSKAGKRGIEDETIFKAYSLGVSTNRDRVLYNFDRAALVKNARSFIDHYNAEVDRYKREWGTGKNEDGSPKDLDEFLDITHIKWSRNLKSSLKKLQYMTFDETRVRRAMYRPFTEMFLYFQNIAVDESGQFHKFFPTEKSEGENRVICVPTVGFRDAWSVMVTDKITDLHFTSGDGNQCFPFYVYDEDGSNRTENITDWALERFRDNYGDEAIGKWDIFYYIYGALHQPSYRLSHAEELKKELPRVPLAEDFWVLSKAGKQLAEIHLAYKEAEPWPLDGVYADGTPLSFHVEKMKLSRDKSALVINDTFTLTGLPEEALKYRVGSRSPLEWVIDQYQVYTDPRSGIEDNPNRPDDPEFIVQLAERVIRVSMETAEIMGELPAD